MPGLLGIAGVGITIAVAILGYFNARSFVRSRLRFVDGVQRRVAPWIAGAGAALIATPIAAVLPLVGISTALLFGASVGVGVAHGARDIRRGTAGLLEP